MPTPTSTPSTDAQIRRVLQIAARYIGRRPYALSPAHRVVALNLVDRGVLIVAAGVLDYSAAADDAAARLY